MDYVNVKIPKPIADDVDELIKADQYASRAEFIKEAIRLRLEELKKAKEA